MGDGPEAAAAQRGALRAFAAGDLSVLDAAEHADLSVSDFLDLLDRMQSADAAAVDPVGEPPVISVVVPVFNEDGNLVPLLAELIPVLESVGTYEVVFVDDGSTDRSLAV